MSSRSSARRRSSPMPSKRTASSPPRAAAPMRLAPTRCCWCSSRRTTRSSGCRSWDTLGMRGTHSEGFTLRARARAAQQILPEPYEKIHRADHGAVRASAVGLGVGGNRRRRHRARRRPSCATRCAPPADKCRRVPPHFTQAALDAADAARRAGSANLRSYQAVMDDEKALASLEFQAMITLDQGAGLRAGGDHGLERAARLRPVGLSQRHASSASAACCATCCRPRS